ncbi:protein of unknown function [Taphrina deformans PYCC 5710]|uniref:SWR1-complex protein 4 n=1 Tax=Taphrina deformans (strain PYCC 5710 / ATCC 11124 / CBS 356.35 / IMI 108563 / JCM 9778 / NBRC 8474) TaxID=1097556 RepID=R4XDC0_TAPDE|nr:protein of unknown function [Taphrina deformans PYCC 5710]|eukprot:CCG83876.1 protein of unknown function [Taphrina deformans PYCC 5710]
MSAADIRDVLGMGDLGPATKKLKLSTDKRAEGMSRELYNLIGNSSPPVVTLQSKFKEKPKFRQRAAKWSLVTFKNGGRSDDLQLSHWTRGISSSDAAEQPYRFEAFNKHADVITYTKEEYSTYLEKSGWTKDDTDLLIELCTQFDLRFIVIHDRWSDYSKTPKTIEQLKDRYYGVARSLLASRGQSTEGLSYDYQKETTRKQYLEELFNRTPEQIEEEHRLLMESRRLEANEKTLAQQKADLIRLLETPIEQGSAEQYMSSAGYGSLAQSMLTADKQKHKKRPSEVPPLPATPKQKYRKLSPREEREKGVSWHDKLSGGVYLRSQKTVALKQTFATKVQAAMQELGMSNVLTMPTEKTVRKFDQLQQKIGILLEAKRVCDRVAETSDVKEE